MTEYKPGDIVRVVAPPGGTGHIGMIGSYIGQEARIIHKHPTEDLWQIELDVPRKPAAFGGRLDAPTFVVRSDMIEPDVTEVMLRAACAVEERIRERNPSMDNFGEPEMTEIYRAMRAARFER